MLHFTVAIFVSYISVLLYIRCLKRKRQFGSKSTDRRQIQIHFQSDAIISAIPLCSFPFVQRSSDLRFSFVQVEDLKLNPDTIWHIHFGLIFHVLNRATLYIFSLLWVSVMLI